MDRGSRSPRTVTLVSSDEIARKARKIVRRWFMIGWILAISYGYLRWHLEWSLWRCVVLGVVACLISDAVMDRQLKKLSAGS